MTDNTAVDEYAFKIFGDCKLLGQVTIKSATVSEAYAATREYVALHVKAATYITHGRGKFTI